MLTAGTYDSIGNNTKFPKNGKRICVGDLICYANGEDLANNTDAYTILDLTYNGNYVDVDTLVENLSSSISYKDKIGNRISIEYISNASDTNNINLYSINYIKVIVSTT